LYIFHLSESRIKPTQTFKNIPSECCDTRTKEVVITIRIPFVRPITPIAECFKLREKPFRLLMFVPHPRQCSQVMILLKFFCNPPECIGIHFHVAIQEYKNFSPGFFCSSIPRSCRPAVFFKPNIGNGKSTPPLFIEPFERIFRG